MMKYPSTVTHTCACYDHARPFNVIQRFRRSCRLTWNKIFGVQRKHSFLLQRVEFLVHRILMLTICSKRAYCHGTVEINWECRNSIGMKELREVINNLLSSSD